MGNTFELEPGEYEAILEYQGGVCAICKKAKGVARRLAVDHDHEIEKSHGMRASIRGLLCSPCNKDLLGRYTDEALLAAIEYRRNPPARKVLK